MATGSDDESAEHDPFHVVDRLTGLTEGYAARSEQRGV
jgi:hypothetical protein